MISYATVQVVLTVCSYIVLSAILISFNKQLLQRNVFPHPTALTAFHMASTSILLLGLYACNPEFFPMLKKTSARFKDAIVFVLPSGLFFAMAMYFSNQALEYSSIAFVQYCKEGNVAIIFFLSCLAGLQSITLPKLVAIAVVLIGCFLCTSGELEFSSTGFAFQMIAQFSDSSKNIIMEMLLGKTGLKLDVLTYLAFQAPFSLMWLVLWLKVDWEPAIVPAFLDHWPLLLINALAAFFLNLTAAMTVKHLSAMGFVMCGFAKDLLVLCSSVMVFHSPISTQQLVAFPLIMLGLFLWTYLRSKEANDVDEMESIRKTSLPVYSKQHSLSK